MQQSPQAVQVNLNLLQYQGLATVSAIVFPTSGLIECVESTGFARNVTFPLAAVDAVHSDGTGSEVTATRSPAFWRRRPFCSPRTTPRARKVQFVANWLTCPLTQPAGNNLPVGRPFQADMRLPGRAVLLVAVSHVLRAALRDGVEVCNATGSLSVFGNRDSSAV